MSGTVKRRTSSPDPFPAAPESGATNSGPSLASSSRSSDNIQVFVRLRPLSQAERQKGQVVAWATDGAGGVGPLQRGALAVKFVYDRVFDAAADNSQVFEAVAQPLLGPVLGGTSATVLAYGVTSSGKTHTMMGRQAPPPATAADASSNSSSSGGEAGLDTGLVQRCLAELFAAFHQATDRQYSATMSIMEVYCEQLNDLLDPSKVNLEVAEVPVKGGTPGLTSLVIKGLTEVKVSSLQAALDLFKKGQDARKVGSTAFNDQSSRSHTLCRLHITSCPVDSAPSAAGTAAAGGGGGAVTTTSAYLTLADLAGSEGASATTSRDQRLEAANINRSLLTLGKVIWELGRAKGAGGEAGGGEVLGAHVPFRDSLLTRLLKPSLTGLGARVALVCCIAPGSGQSEETRNTLLFADGAKRIRVVAAKQEAVDWPLLVRRLQGELAAAQQQLAALGGSPTGGLSSGGSTSLCCPTGLAVADADYQQLQLSLQLAQEQRNLLLAERNALSGLNQQLMALALAGTPDGIVAGGDAGQEQDTGASRDSTGQEQQEQQVVGSISSTGVATRGSGLRRALSAESAGSYAYWLALSGMLPCSQAEANTAATAAGPAAAVASQPHQQHSCQQEQECQIQPLVACLSATSSVGGASLRHGLLRLSDESDLAGGGALEMPLDLLPDSTRSSWGGGNRQQCQQQEEHYQTQQQQQPWQPQQEQGSQQPSGLVDASAPTGVRMRRSLSLNGGDEGDTLVDFSAAEDPDDLLLGPAPGPGTLHAILGTVQRPHSQQYGGHSAAGRRLTEAEPSSSGGLPLSLQLLVRNRQQLLHPRSQLTAAWASTAVLQQRVAVLQQQVELQGALLQQQRAWERETDMELRLAVVAADRALLREELTQVQQQLAAAQQQLAAARTAVTASPVQAGASAQRQGLSRSSSSTCSVRDVAMAGGGGQLPQGLWSRSSTPDMFPDKPSSIPLPQLGSEPSSSSLAAQPSTGMTGATSISRRGSCSGNRVSSSVAAPGRGEGPHPQGMPPRPVPPGGLSPRGVGTEGGGVDVKMQSRIPSPIIMMGSSGAPRPPSGSVHR